MLLHFCRTTFLETAVYMTSLVQQGSNPRNFGGQYSWLEIKTHCLVFVCFLQTSVVVLFREMSRKMTMSCSNLLTIKYVGLIWFVHQQHIVKITSIKLLTYKVTVKHFICPHNIVFEFCQNKRKQCSNEEPKEMPLRVQLLSFFPLASTWKSNTQFLEWKQVVFPSLDIYIGEFLMRVGGGISSCVWQTLLIFLFLH